MTKVCQANAITETYTKYNALREGNGQLIKTFKMVTFSLDLKYREEKCLPQITEM